MGNKKIKMIPIDGQRFKREIEYAYGSVRKYAAECGYSFRAIYNYISRNAIPQSLLAVTRVKNGFDNEADMYKKGYTDGYRAAMEEMKKFMESSMEI